MTSAIICSPLSLCSSISNASQLIRYSPREISPHYIYIFYGNSIVIQCLDWGRGWPWTIVPWPRAANYYWDVADDYEGGWEPHHYQLLMYAPSREAWSTTLWRCFMRTTSLTRESSRQFREWVLVWVGWHCWAIHHYWAIQQGRWMGPPPPGPYHPQPPSRVHSLPPSVCWTTDNNLNVSHARNR